MSTSPGGTPLSPGGTPVETETPTFASVLQVSMREAGLSLVAVHRRLRERGHQISLSALSMWRSGARRPEREPSKDVVRELEQILNVPDGSLLRAVRPSGRVRPTRHETFAALMELRSTALTVEPPPELFERSGAVRVYVDARGAITRTVNRTLWQAAKDGAREATVFYGAVPPAFDLPQITGTIGCEIVDLLTDEENEIIRGTLRLTSPLHQGALVLTEREMRRQIETDPETAFTIVAPRRQAEVTLHVDFDPLRVPRACSAYVENDGESRSHYVALNGTSITHAEFDFGPGVLTLNWDW